MSQALHFGEEDQVFAFVNFDHPSQLKDQTKRTIIQTHVGKYHRNRSRPAQRRHKLNEPAVSCQVSEVGNKLRPVADCYRLSDGHGCGRTDTGHQSPRRSPQDIHFTAASTPFEQGLCYTQEFLRTLVKESQQIERSTASAEERKKQDKGEESYIIAEAYYRTKTASLTDCMDRSRKDPFGKYPVKDCGNHIPALVDHAVQYFWSCLSPDRRYGIANPVNSIYLAHMRSSPLACYTYTLVISTNIDYLWDTHPLKTRYQALRAEHICAATQLVREAIQQMPEKPDKESISDELIGSIMALASCHQINASIDMWGALPFLNPHRLAVVQLVNLRGGILKLSSPYLAGVVQLNDLVDASRNTSKPLLVWENLLQPLPELAWPVRDDRSSSSGVVLTSSFVALFANIVSSDDLEIAISAIAHTTSALHIYYQDGQPNSSIVDLVESRNRAQSLTLSLPSALTFATTTEPHDDRYNKDTSVSVNTSFSSCFYEVIRLSLLVYNNLVIYPMPPASGVDDRLAKSLRVAIDRLFTVNCSTKIYQSEWLAWSLILGGISGQSEWERYWYRDHFCRLLEVQLKLHEWQRLEDLLSSFLWFKVVLDEEALKFWSQCMVKFKP